MDKTQLIEMAKDNIAHAKEGTIDKAPGVFKVPAAHYYDEDRFDAEVNQIFKRLPLVLAATAEMPNPGDYKSMEAVGVPVLLTRGKDGEVRAFINSCTHRGTYVVVEGKGHASRFVCPYHGWTFDRKGALIGVAAREDFGEFDASCYGLTPLPAVERCGLIWVTLKADSSLDMDAFLSGYDDLLDGFGFEDWHYFSERTLKGPNWKIAYDGYLDFYHLPILHRDTFGANTSNKALYYSWGPHQRVTAPSAEFPLPDDKNMILLDGKPEEEWDTEPLMTGVWTIFPHVSIATFYGGGRGVMISQLFPGDKVGESYTTQLYLTEGEPTEQQRAEAESQFKLLEYVVETEDYDTGLRQQHALKAGAREYVLFGRNEGGGQQFHRWVQQILDTDDEGLNGLFERPRIAAE